MKLPEKELCPECDEWTTPDVMEMEEKVIVRKEKFTVKVKKVFCTNCKKEIGMAESGFDEKEIAYDLYRRKHNYLFPEDIKRIREKYGLGQKPFSRLLGFGEITIHLYEKGALPDDTHIEMLKLAGDPENIKVIYENNKEAISETDRQAFEKKLDELLVEKRKNKLKEIILDTFNYEPDIYCGFRKFILDYVVNFFKLMLKIHSPLYTTHMVKIPCYLDFIKFKLEQTAFTGFRYVIGKHGPFLDGYDKFLCYLVDTGAADSILDFPGDGKLYFFKEEPDLSLFSEKDLQLIKKVTEKLGVLTPTQLSERSHKEIPGWDENKIGQLLSFEYAKYSKIFED